jgi:hypothetical protein
MNWKITDNIVNVLAWLSVGFFIIYGAETNSVKLFGFGILGLILLMNHYQEKANEKKFILVSNEGKK